MRVSFGYEDPKIGILSTLTYQLASFTLDGKFRGFETLSSQLLACQISNQEVAQLRRFGSTITQSCTFDLSNLISSSIYDHPEQENLFYELYLQDYNGDLIDIPVLIRNFQDATGQRVNDAGQTDQTKWRLTRRFFLFDTKSGIEGTNGYVNGAISTVVRYPMDITLRVKLDPDNDEMILNPLLIVNYRERSRTGVAANSLATVSFTTEYAMDTTNFWQTTRGLFIGVLILLGVVILVQMCIWTWSPNQLSDDQSAKCKFAIVKFIITCLDVYSNLVFWFLVIMAGYWFIFFKL